MSYGRKVRSVHGAFHLHQHPLLQAVGVEDVLTGSNHGSAVFVFLYYLQADVAFQAILFRRHLQSFLIVVVVVGRQQNRWDEKSRPNMYLTCQYHYLSYY